MKAKSVHHLLSRRLHERAGLLDAPDQLLTFDGLSRSEWSPKFEELMRNRLVLGALRYGVLHKAGKPAYDRVAGALKRLSQYQATGNKECLVDVANMMLLGFEEGLHPLRHWNPLNEDHCCTHPQ